MSRTSRRSSASSSKSSSHKVGYPQTRLSANRQFARRQSQPPAEPNLGSDLPPFSNYTEASMSGDGSTSTGRRASRVWTTSSLRVRTYVS